MSALLAENETRARAPAARDAGSSLRPFEDLARLSLVLGTVAGFGLGLLLLLPVAFGVPLELPWLPLAQVHGQVQTLGFAGLFILAVGTVIFPRFLNAPRWNARQARLGGLLLGAGVVLRACSQPLEPSALRAVLLLGSGLLTLAGPVLFALAMHRGRAACSRLSEAWQLAMIIGFGALLGALLLNLWAVVGLAIEGASLVPTPLDYAIVHLELRGFVVGVGLAVSLKIFPQFLLLRRPRSEAYALLLPGYGVGVLVGALGWLLLLPFPTEHQLAASIRSTGDVLSLLALVGLLVALRLYEPAARESGRPRVTNPIRLWIRLAYGWLLMATLLFAALNVRGGLGGPVGSFTELSAARHAVAMGFLMILLVGMASRILPGYSGWALRHPRFLNATVGLLTLGALLRVGAELVGGYGGISGPISGSGAALGVAGFALFAASLWPALGRLPHSPLPAETSCCDACAVEHPTPIRGGTTD